MNFQVATLLKHFSIPENHAGATTGTKWYGNDGTLLKSISPIDNTCISTIQLPSNHDLEFMFGAMRSAFLTWQTIPAPKRGEIVKQIGEEINTHKHELAALISFEMGKIYSEALGEVQEIIDICDFAVGQSRMLYGKTMPSERPQHRLMEQWHPIGIVGIISAFNFPVAVWGWNAMLALICGNVVLWKPSSKTPFCAIAIHKLLENVLRKNNLPEGICNLYIANSSSLGNKLLEDKRIPLFSITGSTNFGKKAASIIAARFGKAILELGGNNAVIVTEHAPIDLALQAVVFGAVGTCGQRCTTTRRVIIHTSIYNLFKEKLVQAYKTIHSRIGNPLDANTLIGPLIDQKSVDAFLQAQKTILAEGGSIIFGGEVLQNNEFSTGNFVVPCIAEAKNYYKIVQQETFAPIIYLLEYTTLEEAIALQNSVPQGLSSSIFTSDLKESELFLSSRGSDCGIANINIGTSGAEIGGAFGGEKETGGGRESGSDAWQAYMRRQTNTINYGDELPLAQGIKWDIK